MASVFLSELDLNDYIGPSEACIIPLIDNIKHDKKPSTGKVKIHKTTESNTIKPKEKATISISDCLACSGCITSAESILVESHSIDKLKDDLMHSESKFKIVTISPASFVDICRYMNDNVVDAWYKLSSFFETYLDIDLIIDGLILNDVSTLESSYEFIIRFHNSIPMLASSCPGFVCYVEKMSSSIIPFLSPIKSPMSASGVLFKKILGCEDVYHIAVMPCHDKKLEASKENDIDLVLTTSDIITLIQEQVKCEDENTIKQFFHSLKPTSIPKLLHSSSSSQYNNLYIHSSGGYADTIFKYACNQLFNYYIPPNAVLPWKSLTNQSSRRKRTNKDFMEVSLYQTNGAFSLEDGECVLKFGIAYGFKNIQRVIHMLQNDSNTYHYIEVMACPSGCINGGGQIQSKEVTPMEKRQRLDENYKILNMFRNSSIPQPWNMQTFYRVIQHHIKNPTVITNTKERIYHMDTLNDIQKKKENHMIRKFIHELYNDTDAMEIDNDGINDESIDLDEKFFHVTFKSVPKLQFSSGATAGVALMDTKW